MNRRVRVAAATGLAVVGMASSCWHCCCVWNGSIGWAGHLDSQGRKGLGSGDRDMHA